jgi:uncharacterized damage-inducible protein DinB
MNGIQAIRSAMHSTQQILGMYLGDLADADLLVRPAPSANHIAWQLGHIIAGEVMLLKEIPGAAHPELPAGFAKAHDAANAASTSTEGFLSKAEYLNLFNKTRAATLALLDKLTDADLDRPTQGKIGQFAPTHGALLMLISNHTLMHAGQFTVVRRKLGKPIVF